jgi:predicted metalloprotease with PDZ domain
VSRRRRREYELYATTRRGSLTTRSECFPRTHPWAYTVRAFSVKQAYYFANHEVWATDERSVGLLRVERDRWHYRGTPGPRDVEVALYLRDGEGRS